MNISFEMIYAIREVIEVAKADYGEEEGHEFAARLLDSMDPDLLQSFTLSLLTGDITESRHEISLNVSVEQVQTVQAIKTVRGAFHMSLREAKDIIDRAKTGEKVLISQRLDLRNKRDFAKEMAMSGIKVR